MKRNLTFLVALVFLMSWSCNKREHPLYIPGPTQTDTIQAQDCPEKDSFEAKKAELVARIAACQLTVEKVNAKYKPPRPVVVPQTALFPISGE